MDLIKTVLLINFETALRPWLELRDMLRIAGGNESAEIQAGPLIVDREQARQRVVFQVNSLAIEHEAPTSAGDSKQQFLDSLESFNNRSPFPSLVSIRHDAIFIEPFTIPFHQLVDLLKVQYLRPGKLPQQSSDLALIMDEHEETGFKHIQIGPMDDKQLRAQFLRWPLDKLPETFVFLNLAQEAKVSPDYSASALESFLEVSIKWEETQGKAIIDELRQEV